MAFGRKKKAAVQFDQSNVATLASQALHEKRSALVRVAFRLTLATPMLMHRWSTKAIIEFLGKMVGQPQPRGLKDLTQDYEASYYRNTNGQPVVPCRVIKAGIIEGAIVTDGVVTKAELKRSLRVLGFTTPIRLNGDLQMDCRLASNNGTPDMRARAVVPAGSHFDIVVQFPTTLTPDKVVAALEGCGACIGLCDWRPDRGGEYGTFTIDVLPDKDIARILKECSVPEEEYRIPPEFLRAFAQAENVSDGAKKAAAVVSKVNGDARRAKRGNEALRS